MHFGIVLHVSATYANWHTFKAIAEEAERLGYDSVWVSDHFISPSGNPHALEAWTVLSALAASTHKIRLGTYVLCNQFRHPSLLAKMATTLDNVSEGRLEFGIGAGWLKTEHAAFGFDWNKRSERIKRLKESIQIIKRLMTEPHVSYHGRYFQIKDATLEPKPPQKPNPTVWVGGNSAEIRNIVAEVGDGWIPVLPTPTQLASGVRDIKEKMRQAGRDLQTLRIAYGGGGCVLIRESAESVRELAKPLMLSLGKRKAESTCLIGTPEQCIRKIELYQEAGAQAIVAGFYDFPSLEGLRFFAKSVMPRFRSKSSC